MLKRELVPLPFSYQTIVTVEPEELLFISPAISCWGKGQSKEKPKEELAFQEEVTTVSITIKLTAV